MLAWSLQTANEGKFATRYQKNSNTCTRSKSRITSFCWPPRSNFRCVRLRVSGRAKPLVFSWTEKKNKKITLELSRSKGRLSDPVIDQPTHTKIRAASNTLSSHKSGGVLPGVFGVECNQDTRPRVRGRLQRKEGIEARVIGLSTSTSSNCSMLVHWNGYGSAHT
jgi:hypothetical protein